MEGTYMKIPLNIPIVGDYLQEAIVQGKKTYVTKNLGDKVSKEDVWTDKLCKADNIESSDDLQGKYTIKEFEKAVVSCASYSIFYVLNEMHYEIREAIKATRNHKLCRAINGFKKEMIRLEGFDKSHKNIEVSMEGKDSVRIREMCKYVHEDLEKNRQRMIYTVRNWMNSIRYSDVDLACPWIMAQLMTDFACNFIKARVMEVAKYRPKYLQIMDVVPTRLLDLVKDVEDRIFELVPDHSDNDINDCKELQLGIRVIEQICLDIDQMQYYCAAGIEKQIGKDALKQENSKIYYLLHPMEDPKWIATRDLKYMEEKEREARAGISYTSKDVIEYEELTGQDVNIPLTIEKAEQLKGWKVIKRKKTT